MAGYRTKAQPWLSEDHKVYLGIEIVEGDRTWARLSIERMQATHDGCSRATARRHCRLVAAQLVEALRSDARVGQGPVTLSRRQEAIRRLTHGTGGKVRVLP